MTADGEKKKRIMAAARKEIVRAKTSIYGLNQRIAELEAENEELKRQIEELKQTVKMYKVKWGLGPES